MYHAVIDMKAKLSDRVSVIVPFGFFEKKKVERTVSSILAQTHRNLELILVDNTLLDGDLIQIDDPRVVVIKRSKIQRAFYARNEGILASQSEYICIVDCGDEISEDHLEVAVKRLNETNADVYSTGYVNIYPNGSIETRMRKKTDKLTIIELLLFNPIGHSSVVTKRSPIFFYPEYDLRHDVALWIRLLKKGYQFEINTDIKMKRFMSKFSISKNKFNALFWLIKVYRQEAKINWYKTFIFLSASISLHIIRYTRIKYSLIFIKSK